MSAPSLTLRNLQNEETGIDICVPRFREEEAPLGGISILYEIAVLTRLDLFKTRLHRNEDVVQFSVYKAYREVEDLYNKLNKKYPKAGLPSIPKFSSIDKYTSDEKVEALDRFMQAVAKNVELCHSSTFTHFIGINSQRLPSFSVPTTSSSDIESKPEESKELVKQNVSEDLSKVFPKVKSNVPKPDSKVDQPLPAKKENIDLFEEVKLVKDTEKVSDIKKGAGIGGLFDDFEDDSLFSADLTPKPVSPPKVERRAAEVKPRKKETEKNPDEVIVDDSEIIIKERKLGNISLFQEQDLGDYVNKEEEALFLVTPNNNEKSNKNNLLFSNDFETPEPDSELHENLDDLLNLNPLPTSSAPKKPSTDVPENKDRKSSVSGDTDLQCEKPVPLPRKKCLGKSDTEEQTSVAPPEVKPRKVFLKKPDVPSKPVLAAQDGTRPIKPPPISAKPVLLKKPKPPTAPKPAIQKDSKDLDALNANQPAKLENQTSISSLAEDLNKLDILKYIEQEQKTLESEPSLFD